jgi:hypothetical protein
MLLIDLIRARLQTRSILGLDCLELKIGAPDKQICSSAFVRYMVRELNLMGIKYGEKEQNKYNQRGQMAQEVKSLGSRWKFVIRKARIR